jgi:thiol peroxidase
MISDHKFASFGENYGTLIKDWRIESRAIFVVDAGDHTVFLGAVRQTACRDGRPLVYFGSSYRRLD